MVKDHQQLWEDITTSRTAYEAKAVPTLIEILADKEGRDFISRLERKDAESCIEILGHVSCNLHSPPPFTTLTDLVRASQSTGLGPPRRMLSLSR